MESIELGNGKKVRDREDPPPELEADPIIVNLYEKGRISYGLFRKWNLVFVLWSVAGAFLGVLGNFMVYYYCRDPYRETVL